MKWIAGTFVGGIHGCCAIYKALPPEKRELFIDKCIERSRFIEGFLPLPRLDEDRIAKGFLENFVKSQKNNDLAK